MPKHKSVKTPTPTSTEVGFDTIIDINSNIKSKNSCSNHNDNNNINKEPAPICPKEQHHLAYFALGMAWRFILNFMKQEYQTYEIIFFLSKTMRFFSYSQYIKL